MCDLLCIIAEAVCAPGFSMCAVYAFAEERNNRFSAAAHVA